MDNVVWKFSLPTHNKIKSRILDIIDNYEQVNPCKDPVTKTDFYDKICYTTKEAVYATRIRRFFPKYWWKLVAKNS